MGGVASSRTRPLTPLVGKKFKSKVGQKKSQASVGVVRSVPTQQLSPFYLLSTRDISPVISFTRPSSRLFFFFG